MQERQCGVSFSGSVDFVDWEAAQLDAAQRRSLLLGIARGAAEISAREDPGGLCSVDDVFRLLGTWGLCAGDLGPVAGNIFRYGAWRLTSMRIKSRRASNRSREVKVWRLARGCACHAEDDGTGGFASMREALRYVFRIEARCAAARSRCRGQGVRRRRAARGRSRRR